MSEGVDVHVRGFFRRQADSPTRFPSLPPVRRGVSRGLERGTSFFFVLDFLSLSPSDKLILIILLLSPFRLWFCFFDVPICCTPLSACGPIFSSLATWGPHTARGIGALTSLAARRVLPCHGRFRRIASRLPAVLSPLAGVRQHPVEVATETEPLSLSIDSVCTCFVVALECVLLASLPRACSPLTFLALSVLAFGFLASCVLAFGIPCLECARFWLPCLVPCVSRARHRATESVKSRDGRAQSMYAWPVCRGAILQLSYYTPGALARPDPTSGVPLWTSAVVCGVRVVLVLGALERWARTLAQEHSKCGATALLPPQWPLEKNSGRVFVYRSSLGYLVSKSSLPSHKKTRKY
jgi:hypothetical protein